jgi:hypothetical protein
LILLTQTVLALVQRSVTLVNAAETAAWQLKWIMIPVTLLVFFGSRRLYTSIRQSPDRFCGRRSARNGYFASVAVPLLVLILIGITVPTRLRHRQWGMEAGIKAQGYATDRVLRQYREQFGTFPSDKQDLARLPDPDGSIAALLKEIDGAEYKPSAEVAAVPTQNPRTLRGEVIRKASFSSADEPLSEGLSFTNYEVRLPGADKILNNEDDMILRDGVIDKASETPHRRVSTTSATRARRP